ncbi:16.9 kDa class I heat shock protein 2 [Amborella trichopoda]|uniref:Uncharacterized protein n=1 Tax=Amborella trichopoda TaxID=13333 RepID=W1PW91_AMBTC|nr:16.9 kDa class I heat shock protein 2 [Amborella trichopoda]ERN12016.1 hypothetical protein AMTR_s00165p00056090 [Amborella trichopoda]|eukprot:XP_006850435.1 16.9 kDa class I heat shock protein 2 [Amborella trichopoda]
MAMMPTGFGRRSNVFDPFSLDIWDPFEAFLPSPFNMSPRSLIPHDPTSSAILNPRFDWKETDNAHIIKADLPGLNKEDVKVELEEGSVLRISGERKKEVEEENEKWHRVERSHGKFVRRFRLPNNAKVDEVNATMENGVLTVTIPKGEVRKPVVKSIEVSGCDS